MAKIGITRSLVSNSCSLIDIVRNLPSNTDQFDGLACLNTSEDHNQFSYLFLNPVAKLTWQDFNYLLSTPERSIKFNSSSDLFSIIDEIFLEFDDFSIPCIAGLLKYEFYKYIEKTPFHLSLESDAIFYIYDTVIKISNSKTEELEIFQFNFPEFKKPFWKIDQTTLFRPTSTPAANGFERHESNGLINELSKLCETPEENFVKGVNDIQNLIRAGEVYQVNLSAGFRLEGQVSSPREFFLSTLNISPGQKSGIFCIHDNNSYKTIVSTSPELFFETKNQKIKCAPIKGTIKRGTSETEDENLIAQLESSEKDRAELAMITDLIRNDLGKICIIDSVTVENFARVTSTQQVHHLVSDISGRLSSETKISEIIRALFPCGSITGAPKIAAIKYIYELEDQARDIYTGSMGFIGPNQYSSFNVAIRTCILENDICYFRSGAGIVIDSDPESEFYEILHKAKGLYLCWKC